MNNQTASCRTLHLKIHHDTKAPRMTCTKRIGQKFVISSVSDMYEEEIEAHCIWCAKTKACLEWFERKLNYKGDAYNGKS